MTARARKVLTAAVGATLLSIGTFTPATASAEAVNFTMFTPVQGIPTNFVDAQWSTPDSFNGIPIPPPYGPGSIARETTNADTTMFVGPSTLDVMNKIITGDLYAGNDDDPIGIALGVPTANGNPMQDFTADFLLLQWKGLSQNFDYNDRLAPGDVGYSPFHDSTVGGSNPIGLSLSRVKGLPTADEYWQRTNLTMYDSPTDQRAPDPAVDPILGGGPEFDSGGLTELARGNVFGSRTYGQRHRFEIHYTPENIKVFVDGALEFDVNAPAGQLFPSGTLALYEQAQDPSGAFAFFDVRNPSDPAPSTPPSLLPVISFGGADVTVPAPSNTDAASTWTIVRGTAGTAGAITLLSPPNVADVDFALGGNPMLPSSGILFPTVRQNGPRANNPANPADARYGGAESPFDSGFGGAARAGVATFGFGAGGEWNTDVAVAYFPYERFKGGYVTPQGAIRFSNDSGPNTPYTITQKSVPLPSVVKYANNLDGTLPTGTGQPFFAGNQQFITNVAIRDKHSQTGPGLLFTVGASNEDNFTSVAILPDGTWNVAVRDNDAHFYGGPDTFEQDNFAFLYLEPTDMPGSAGGRVTGLTGGNPTFAQSWGDYTLTRADTGVYQLSIDGGESYVINILGHRLTGDFTFTDTDTNGDGTPDTRTFNDTQDLVPEFVDSPFSFAFVPFEEGGATGPGMLLLTPNGTITLSDGTVAPLNYWMTYQLGTVPVIPRWAVDAGGAWSTGTNWTGGAAPNAPGATAVLGGAITAPRQVQLDAPVTLGTLRFEGDHAYTVAGPSTLTLDATTGSATISTTGPAHHVISAPLTFADDTTITVAQPGATLTLVNVAPTQTKVTKTGPGTLVIDQLRARALDVQSGTVRLPPRGAGAAELAAVEELTLAGATGNWTSTLDITDNTFIIGGVNSLETLARVTDQIKHARDRGSAGRWSGAGITSSTAASNSITGIATAYMFGSGNIVLRYTYNGDANLDGKIDADDYFRIDQNFLAQPVDPLYTQGDFNYDGTINADDYFQIDQAFLGQGAPLGGGIPAAALAAVPEPTAGAFLMLLALGTSRTLATRARRRKKDAALG